MCRSWSIREIGGSFAVHQGSIRSINLKPVPISFVYGLFPSDFLNEIEGNEDNDRKC